MPILDLVPFEPDDLAARNEVTDLVADPLAAALAALDGMAAVPPNPRRLEIQWSAAMLSADRGKAFNAIRDRAQELGLASICYPDLRHNCTNMLILAAGEAM